MINNLFAINKAYILQIYYSVANKSNIYTKKQELKLLNN